MPGRTGRWGIARPTGPLAGSGSAQANGQARDGSSSADSAEDRGDRPGRRRHQFDTKTVVSVEMKSSSDRTSKKGSRKSVSIAPPLGGTRDRVPPVRDTVCGLLHLRQVANQVARDVVVESGSDQATMPAGRDRPFSNCVRGVNTISCSRCTGRAAIGPMSAIGESGQKSQHGKTGGFDP